MKKRISLLFAAALLLLLCACTASGGKLIGTAATPKPEALLKGTWTRQITADADYVEETLDYLSFAPEEIAFADFDQLYYTETLTFGDDGRYSLSDSAEEARAVARSFYEAYIQKLYENLDSLESVYGSTEETTSLADFQDFYAYLFELDSFDAVLDLFTEETYDYTAFGAETGTFTADAERIHFTITGESESEYVDYLLSGDTLTVVYAEDSIAVYTRVS